jgi:hypothetical protein
MAPPRPGLPAPFTPHQPPPAYPPSPHAQPPYSQQPPHAPPPHAQPYSQQPPHATPPHATPPHAQPPYSQQPPHAQPPHAGQPFVEPPVFTRPAQSAVPEAHVVRAGKVGTESSPIQQLAETIEKVPGKFVGFLKISAKRAFRLRIEPTEVLPDERQALEAANPPIVEENLQSFLAWRRSVLFLVATILVPLSIIGVIDAFTGTKVASSIRFVKLLPALAETLFCAICWLQLRRWAHWRSQRKWLFIGWLLFMLTPFVVFVYPLKSAFVGLGKSMSTQQIQELGWHGLYNKAIAPFAFSMIAMFQLAPKVISLMPGLIRASLVIKMLFPGASAPGWLIVLSAPLYAMIAYAILIIPYQFTGNEWFIVGILLIVAAQAVFARSGFQLARPLTQEETLRHVKRVRLFYSIVMLLAFACIIGGLGVLTQIFNMKWTTIVSTVLKFEANVLILTMIGADLVVTNLDRARGYTEGREHVEDETEQKIAAFVGLNAPPTPPPPGPAPADPLPPAGHPQPPR